jgi:predicted TIM-barrel fold metal-dependent hydrolase
MQRSLDEASVDYTVCLPIAPYVTFDDLARARQQEPRILPFTSVDFTCEHDIAAQLAEDRERGALGLKLHPIIQSTRLDDPRTREALRACSDLKLPVLIHGGVSNYYMGKEKSRNIPTNGRIAYIENAIRDFPAVNFIVGHAGLFQVKEVCRRLKGLSNVWVDTSLKLDPKNTELLAGSVQCLGGHQFPVSRGYCQTYQGFWGRQGHVCFRLALWQPAAT